MNSRKDVAGFSLLELMVVLIIIAGLAVLAGGWFSRAADETMNRTFAETVKEVSRATNRYVEANRAAIVAAAGPTTPVTITIAQLKAAQFLDAGFAESNRFGQVMAIRVIEPTPDVLRFIIVTTGGTAMDGLNARRTGNLMGFGGGAVLSESPTVLKGSFGQVALAPYGLNPGAGRVGFAGFAADEGAADDDSLKRSAMAGRPERNRMSTSIDLAGNNIANGGVIAGRLKHTSGYLEVDSYNTGSYGAGTGRLWWNANAGQLSVVNANNGARGDVVAGNVLANGDVSGNTVTANRVNSNEVYAAGWLRTTGAGGWYSEAYGGGIHMTDATWIRTYNGKSFYSSGEVRGNRVTSEGRLTSGEFVQINGVATAGAACSGRILALDAGGGVLSCQAGRWADTSGPGLAKAWVNFNGQACYPACTIRSSFNVAAVQRLSMGDYLVTLSSPIIDSSSAVNGSGVWSSAQHSFNFVTAYAANTQQIRVYATEAGSRNGYWYKVDLEAVSVTVFR